MIKVIEYVKDALPAVGKYVLLDGYMGRLAIKRGLDPNNYSTTYDFIVCVGGKIHVPAFPTFLSSGVYPLLLSGVDLTDQEPDVEDVYTVEELKKYSKNFTFNLDDDEDEEEDYCCDWKGTKKEEKEEEDDSEGDKLMDFFFNEKKKVVKEEEEREAWGKDGFEFF